MATAKGIKTAVKEITAADIKTVVKETTVADIKAVKNIIITDSIIGRVIKIMVQAMDATHAAMAMADVAQEISAVTFGVQIRSVNV